MQVGTNTVKLRLVIFCESEDWRDRVPFLYGNPFCKQAIKLQKLESVNRFWTRNRQVSPNSVGNGSKIKAQKGVPSKLFHAEALRKKYTFNMYFLSQARDTFINTRHYL